MTNITFRWDECHKLDSVMVYEIDVALLFMQFGPEPNSSPAQDI
jgi:hypothetical protein